MRYVREVLPCAYKLAVHARCVAEIGNESSHHDHGPLDYGGQANRGFLILQHFLFILYMAVLAWYRLRLSLNDEREGISTLDNNWVL